MKVTIKSLEQKAVEIGQKAFKEGFDFGPHFNEELKTILEDLNYSAVVRLYKAYTRGWMIENRGY